MSELVFSVGAVSAMIAIAFVAGIVLFSGSMYTHALTGWRAPLRLTPVAGIAMLVGWGTLAISPFA